ncbi:hypothetical protein ZOD2009_11055 [Haladaptatus paucihalophilus DX253]|uniref:Uncharacterized protein n=1 Tax=Haladaptatus paucihalophilus DX253 TaxID=797209 RepID=E7QTT3_HALPU|nr:hypothetical protein ZOD2009_11055 [Haladaptatus paucihalophilus DX253]
MDWVRRRRERGRYEGEETVLDSSSMTNPLETFGA